MNASAQRLVDRASVSPLDFRSARAAGYRPLGRPATSRIGATAGEAALASRRQQQLLRAVELNTARVGRDQRSQHPHQQNHSENGAFKKEEASVSAIPP
jgi:hypothetical protein